MIPMIRLYFVICILACLVVCLTGCWSSFELIDKGFIQAAAIDQTNEGKIRLTSVIYKPGGSQQSITPSSGSSIHIISSGNTVFEAVRDVTTELGRKLQWSHMRVILISDEVAKSKDISQILDFFYRDHEPRGTISVFITKGKAGDYLKAKPFIESTMGQQLKKSGDVGSAHSGKTVEVSLTKLKIQSMKEVPVAIIPYISFKHNSHTNLSVSGLATVDFQTGHLTEIISPANSKYLLMLTNHFKGGIIEIPCENEKKKKSSSYDSFEIMRMKTKIKPIIKKDSLFLDVNMEIEGSAGELACSKVITPEEVKQFSNRVQQTIEQHAQKTIKLLQEKRDDVLDVGTSIYSYHYQVWKKWKPDWKQHFANSEVSIKVKIKLNSSGMISGSPYSKGESK